MRVMALDVGSRTIGVALSDETNVVASGVTTLQRSGTARDVQALLDLIRARDVGRVVVGLPLELSGAEGKRARRVRVLLEALTAQWKGPVETWDERMTTKAANRVLLEADLSRRKRKAVVDQVAATLILQSYLDAKAGTEP